MNAFCCNDARRLLVRKHATLNGIDRLEVVDRELVGTSRAPLRQRILRVFFVKPPAGPLLSRLKPKFTGRVVLTGGDRVTAIAVEDVKFRTNAPLGARLEVRVLPRGDYSTYTLSLLAPDSDQPLAGLDPQLAAVDFWFKIECENKFDCAPVCDCPVENAPAPELDYLAKDYASFRQLILDRMAALLPNWRERNPADLGITLVELLAYVGDYQSYRQDAIATEAYLGTARQRVSVRRHARMLDYAMHDGCNARVWVQVRLKALPGGPFALHRRLTFNTSAGKWEPAKSEPTPSPNQPPRLLRTRFATRLVPGESAITNEDFARLVPEVEPEVFEPLEDAELVPEHNEIQFYAWGSDECCLPRGATKATLRGTFPNLHKGAVLIFAEKFGPKTGDPADADPGHRHAVRLTRVTPNQDTVVLENGAPVPVTEIEWAAADALSFVLCLSSVSEHDGRLIPGVSVALGNIILADHGLTLPLLEPDPAKAGAWLQPGEDAGTVPEPNPDLAPVAVAACGHCSEEPRLSAPPRFHPRLKEDPLTHGATQTRSQRPTDEPNELAFNPAAPAADVFDWDMEHVLPAARLGDSRGMVWEPQRDLLSSGAAAAEFVAEIENDGRATIRFGDDECGMRPGSTTRFAAVYRVGNGTRGNVGAESVVHVVGAGLLDAARNLRDATKVIEAVSNPLPARRGADPETLEQVRQYAPAAFRVPKRAVTPDDYATMAGLHPEVQRAAATLRWTGSWHTIFLTVDRRGGRLVDDDFEISLRDHLEPFRMAGHDLEIDGPRFVSLELKLLVCVDTDYFRSDVEAAVRDVFSRRTRSDGSRGFFHPDNFTFGQPVLLSRIYAAAQAVPGVRHVEILTLRRLGVTRPPAVPPDGVLVIDRLEIARLESDPNFPDRGQLELEMRGGR